jgi:hypothetical protein
VNPFSALLLYSFKVYFNAVNSVHNENNEASNYEIFSSLILIPLSQAQRTPSAPTLEHAQPVSNVRDRVSQPYKTRRMVTVAILCVLMFVLLDIKSKTKDPGRNGSRRHLNSWPIAHTALLFDHATYTKVQFLPHKNTSNSITNTNRSMLLLKKVITLNYENQKLKLIYCGAKLRIP